MSAATEVRNARAVFSGGFTCTACRREMTPDFGIVDGAPARLIDTLRCCGVSIDVRCVDSCGNFTIVEVRCVRQ